MTRQAEFKEELFDLLRRYKIMMSIENDQINFFSHTQHDGEGNVVADPIFFVFRDLDFRWEE